LWYIAHFFSKSSIAWKIKTRAGAQSCKEKAGLEKLILSFAPARDIYL